MFSADKILLIGGIPSSGSTRLVKILSSDHRFFCLPETGIFTKGYQLNPKNMYAQNHLRSEVTWIDVAAKIKHSLGIKLPKYEEHTLFCPISYILSYFKAGAIGKVIVEKTPENIFAFDNYLSASAAHKVIVTTRDVRAVCASLFKRGLSFLDAILIWFAHAYEAWHLITKYPKQVLHFPYQLISNRSSIVFKMINNFFDPKNINYNYTPQQQEIIFSFDMIANILESRSWDSKTSEKTRTYDAKFNSGLVLESHLHSMAFIPIDQTVPINILKLEDMLNNKKVNKDSSNTYYEYKYVDQSKFEMINKLRKNYKACIKCYE